MNNQVQLCFDNETKNYFCRDLYGVFYYLYKLNQNGNIVDQINKINLYLNNPELLNIITKFN